MNLNKSIFQKGIIGGLVAGLVFSVLLGMMGVFPMLAGLVGLSSAFAGFIIHLIISALIGIIFGIIFDGIISDSYGKGISWGLIYGLIWWFLGPMIIMPILLGAVPQISITVMRSQFAGLIGHLLYGLILGIIYPMMSFRFKAHHPKLA